MADDSIISLKNVNKWFGDFHVLQDVNLEVRNDIVHYYSKKLKKYVPVKPKNMDTLYFTIPQRTSDDFVLVKNILGSSDGKERTNA